MRSLCLAHIDARAQSQPRGCQVCRKGGAGPTAWRGGWQLVGEPREILTHLMAGKGSLELACNLPMPAVALLVRLVQAGPARGTYYSSVALRRPAFPAYILAGPVGLVACSPTENSTGDAAEHAEFPRRIRNFDQVTSGMTGRIYRRSGMGHAPVQESNHGGLQRRLRLHGPQGHGM